MRQWWPSAASSRSLDPRSASGEQLLAQPQPLVEVLDVQQRGVAGLQRASQRARVAEAAGHLQRLGAQRVACARPRRRTAGVDEPRPQPDGEQWLTRRAARSAPPRAARCPRWSIIARRGVAAVKPERGLGQRLAVALLAGQRGGARERRARRRVAGAQLAVPSPSSTSRVGELDAPARAGSAPPPPRRRAPPRPARRRPARSSTALRRGRGGGPRRSGRRARRGWRRRLRLQRLADPPVQRARAGSLLWRS